MKFCIEILDVFIDGFIKCSDKSIETYKNIVLKHI